MNFDVLLEGTMAGAELSALTEKVVVNINESDRTKGNDVIVKGLLKQINETIDTSIKYSDEIKGIILNNEKEIHRNAEKLNKIALKSNEINGNNIVNIQKSLFLKSKNFRKNLLDDKKEINNIIDNDIKQLNNEIKKANKQVNKKQSIDICNVYLGKYKSSIIPKLKKIINNINNNIDLIDKDIDKANKIVTKLSKYINVTKFRKFEDFIKSGGFRAAGSIIGGSNKVVEQLDKSESIIDKLKTKLSNILTKVQKEINDPSIGSIIVAVSIAIAVYLILYGVVKSSGGKVQGPANIKATINATADIINNGTVGKKLISFALASLFVTSVGIAGKTGFNYIKNKISGK